MAQRKFAQGANVPPSNSTTNTIVEKRPVDVTRDPGNVFHNKVCAKALLDMITFEGLHSHKPVVVLERLRDVDVTVESDAVRDEVTKSEINLKLLKEASSAPNLSSKLRSLNVTRRRSLLKNSRSMTLRSGARINNNTGKRLATKIRIQEKHLPLRKGRNLRRKAAYEAFKSRRLTPTDAEFSVDDDKPLTYFTRTANLKVSNQTQEGSSPKNNTKSGAMPKDVEYHNNTDQQMSVDKDQDNPSDNQLFNEIQRWMDKSAPGVPPPETFKVPKLPARTRKNQQQTASQRGEDEADANIATTSSQTQSPQASAQRRYENLSDRQSSQSIRSASPMSTTASLDEIGSDINIENEARTQSETSSEDLDIPITQRRRNSRQESARKKKKVDKANLVDAPVFRPTPEEFEDPVTYFEKIMPLASEYGLCKVVAPPGFSPTCNIHDAIRFLVFNQYIARVFSRWGPATRELCTIRSYLASQKIGYVQPPRLGGMEVNLAKLYYAVQRHGGLKAINRKTWHKVAEEVCCGNITNPDKRLDQLYVRYLVPYDTLTKRERQDMLNKMEQLWLKRNKKMLERAAKPLHRQKRLLGETDSSEEEDDEIRYPHMIKALKEAEECIIRGRHMYLHNFKRIAYNTFKKHFPRGAAITEVEDFYWSFVLLGSEHMCVNSASIDTGPEGYGFTKNEDGPYGNHPWNLKMLSKNNGNVLRLLGPVLGLTVPTLHLGMVFSTSCWHRDPHGLPWMEYMHQGSSKIWYGIPDQESERFRKAVEILCPTSCQNKSLWLPSDITMIPPNLLLEHAVSLSRVVQNPGEFIIVFPKAYSSSVCTGYTISESVYFATNSWVNSINQVFQELRESCEPSMFSLEQILISAARDPRASLTMLQLVHASLAHIIDAERDRRAVVESYGLVPRKHTREHNSGSWTVRDEDECEICRTTLYLSRVRGVFRKNGSLCLPHVIQVLEDKAKNISKRAITTYEFDIFFTIEELNEIISTSKKRLLNEGQAT